MAESSTSAVIPPTVRSDYFLIPRVLVSAVLLVAAALKIHQLATEPVVGTGLLAHKWVQLCEAQFEIVLGFWLISGWARRLAWIATLACFVLFCGVTAWEHIHGYASCGCFGKVSVPPLVTLTLDVAIVVLLAALRPRADQPLLVWRWTGPAAAVLVLGLVAVIGSAIPVLRYTPAKVADDGTITGAAETVPLEPKEWVGKQLPIATYIDIAGEISRGEWTVVLVRHGCTGCQALVPKLVERAKRLPRGRVARIALIEVPPFGDATDEFAPKEAGFLTGRLSQPDKSHKWFAETPTVLQLRGGVVMSAVIAQGEEVRAKVAAGPIATTQAEGSKPGMGPTAPTPSQAD